MSKPAIPDVLSRFSAYRKKPGNGAWGCLHIVLDDGNVDNDSVAFCVQSAQEKGDTEGEELARVLLLMSKTQRLKTGRIA